MSCYRNDTYFGFLNAKNNHHALSHAGDWLAVDSDYRKVNRWIADQFGYLVNQMNSVLEPDGTLLDNALAVYNNDCGLGNPHDHKNLPVVVAGSAGGKVPTGRHFANASNTPCGALYTTLLNAMGVDVKGFGPKNSGPLALVV